MNKPLMLLMCAVLLFRSATHAEDEVRTISLSDCIRAGLTNNIKLQNAGIDRAIGQEQAISARAMLDPRLAMGTTYGQSELTDSRSFVPGQKETVDVSARLQKAFSTGTRAELGLYQNRFRVNEGTNSLFGGLIPQYSSGLSLSMSQSLLKNAFGDIDRSLLASAELGSAIAGAIYWRERQSVMLDVVSSYWDLYAAGMNYRTGMESLERARRLLTTNRERVADGLLDETDVLAVEALIATRAVDVLALSNAVAGAKDVLLNLVEPSGEHWDDIRIGFPPNHQVAQEHLEGDPVAVALANRRDVAAVEMLVDLAEMDLLMKKSVARPDLQLLGSVSIGASDSGLDDLFEFSDSGWTVGLSLEVPLFRTAEQSAIRQARLQMKKAMNNSDSLRNAVELECRMATRALVTGQERGKATKRAMELQKRKLDLEKQKFENEGRSATQWVIQAEDDVSIAEMAFNLAIAEYEKSAARYRMAMGLDPVALDEVRPANLSEETN